MSKLILSKRDQNLFLAGLACIVVSTSIRALFGDTVIVWLRDLYTAFLVLGSGLLLIYIVQVSRKR